LRGKHLLKSEGELPPASLNLDELPKLLSWHNPSVAVATAIKSRSYPVDLHRIAGGLKGGFIH
jgi:hypothetical protein